MQVTERPAGSGGTCQGQFQASLWVCENGWGCGSQREGLWAWSAEGEGPSTVPLGPPHLRPACATHPSSGTAPRCAPAAGGRC